MTRPRLRIAALVLLGLGALGACNEQPLQQNAPDAGPAPGGLTAEESGRVLAKVGDRIITLGDYAAALERMDQFDRLRYQTKERRRDLLNEMIDLELLATEARRLGVDKEPDTQEAIRQVLRDALLSQTRLDLPAPAEIPAEEVRAYYDKNLDKFREPERRRVAAIVLTDKKDAEKVLKDALKLSTPAQWGELFYKRSTTAPKEHGASSPMDLAGDLGVVGPPDDPKGANARVPEALRTAVFQIPNVGTVADHVVESDGKLYVVRMVGITSGHTRSLAEADRSIRVALIQQKMQDKEQELDARLRQKFPVQVDERALGSVKMPPGLDKADVGSGASSARYDSDAGAPKASADGGK
jgi:parvulin-like peptidyl-prolyl isomerase